MHYCVLMYWGIPLLIHDSTVMYAIRQGNNYYISHNAAVTVGIPNECLTSTTNRECSPDYKGARKCANQLVGPYTRTCGPCLYDYAML